MALIVLIIIAALAFDFINGFHDTANAIATVVSTRVLKPRTAIFMAAVLNTLGALVSKNVAKTIAGGILTSHAATQTVILCAVIGAIVWNLVTWRYGIPSSSSHALIGGLCGAGFVAGGTSVIQWKGVWEKVIVPLIGSPIIGFILAFFIMTLIFALFAKANPGKVGATFRHLQVLSAAAVAFSHGSNDAQKSMGIITLALVAGGILKGTPAQADIPLWVVLLCALAMGLGTSVGGWRIIATMGHRIMRLEPVNGFAAEVSASAVIMGASYFGFPVSTTHVISGCIFGVGAAKRLNAVRWGVAQRMVVAWVLTIPAAGLVAGLVYGCTQFVH
jgi:PiT family inorganic phosphate transporter